MKVAILSFYSGKNNRGVESWASSLVSHTQEQIKILSGLDTYNPFKWQADIVVPTNGRLQVLLARLLCRKIVVFGHSGPGADDKWNLLCSPNVFVAFSHHQAAWASKFKLPWTKVVVIPHAVDTSVFAPIKDITKTTDVLCVAANSPAKRVGLVTQAIKLLDGVSLTIVGSGQPTQVPFDTMPRIYNQAKVFCFVPQTHEAFGLVYLEAMACNLPVIAVDDPVRREIIGKAGILLPNPEDPVVLSLAINKTLATNWKLTPRHQAEKFSWTKISSLYTKLWADLIY